MVALGTAHISAIAAEEHPRAAGVIALHSFPDASRPAGLYRLGAGSDPACTQILAALNVRHKATIRQYGTFFVSDRFLQSPLSAPWQGLYPGPYVAGIKVRVAPGKAESWIVKYVTWSKPRYGEALYWVPGDADLEHLKGAQFWRAITGRENEAERTQENQIFPFGGAQFYKRPLKEIPIFLWDLVVIDGRPLVLLMSVMNDPSPQALHIRVSALRDRRNADDVCRIDTRMRISGFVF
jgi:hypothetical protein